MNLLIADDENLELKVLEKTLKKNFLNKFNIYQASSGKKASEIVENIDMDIAILDIEMPGMNGIELAKYIKEKRPESVIIFITAYDKFDYAIEAMYVKAFDYLLKPWKEERLINVVEGAMESLLGKAVVEKKFKNPQKDIITPALFTVRYLS